MRYFAYVSLSTASCETNCLYECNIETHIVLQQSSLFILIFGRTTNINRTRFYLQISFLNTYIFVIVNITLRYKYSNIQNKDHCGFQNFALRFSYRTHRIVPISNASLTIKTNKYEQENRASEQKTIGDDKTKNKLVAFEWFKKTKK